MGFFPQFGFWFTDFSLAFVRVWGTARWIFRVTSPSDRCRAPTFNGNLPSGYRTPSPNSNGGGKLSQM
jgi:hypothetical protein